MQESTDSQTKIGKGGFLQHAPAGSKVIGMQGRRKRKSKAKPSNGVRVSNWCFDVRSDMTVRSCGIVPETP